MLKGAIWFLVSVGGCFGLGLGVGLLASGLGLVCWRPEPTVLRPVTMERHTSTQRADTQKASALIPRFHNCSQAVVGGGGGDDDDDDD